MAKKTCTSLVIWYRHHFIGKRVFRRRRFNCLPDAKAACTVNLNVQAAFCIARRPWVERQGYNGKYPNGTNNEVQAAFQIPKSLHIHFTAYPCGFSRKYRAMSAALSSSTAPACAISCHACSMVSGAMPRHAARFTITRHCGSARHSCSTVAFTQ